MRFTSIAPAAAATLLLLSGLAHAQTVQPDATRPSNSNIAAPADKASDPPRNTKNMKADKPASKGDAKSNAAVGSGSSGTVEGRKDGSTNSNSKGEAPKSR